MWSCPWVFSPVGKLDMHPSVESVGGQKWRTGAGAEQDGTADFPLLCPCSLTGN